jgi:hypothetical protein
LLTVSPDVCKEEVAEHHVRDAGIGGCPHDVAHPPLVDLVGTRPRQLDHLHWQSERVGLRLEQDAPDRMHGDPVRSRVNRRHQTNELQVAGRPDDVQSESAVLSA